MVDGQLEGCGGVACVTHASRTRAIKRGDQVFVGGRDALYEGPERWGTRRRLQQVTIEEHQVGDLVFVLLPLLIQVAYGHIDQIIIQYDVAYYDN
jgi:hypothetical protein